MYPYCPPIAFSLTPHHYLHPLFVCLYLLFPSALVMLFPVSPAVPFVMLCPDLFCVIALPRAKTVRGGVLDLRLAVGLVEKGGRGRKD